MTDYYKILGVARTASKDEIKKAYRELAKKYHPDKTKGDKSLEEKFKEINIANEILSDEYKRKAYDNKSASNTFNFRTKSYEDIIRNNNQYQKTEDEFRRATQEEINQRDVVYTEVFRKAKLFKVDDLVFNLHISLEELNTNSIRQGSITRKVYCFQCEGKGAKKSSDLRDCFGCMGTGVKINRVLGLLGYSNERVICNECQGRKKVPMINSDCKSCNGQGIRDDKFSFDFQIAEMPPFQILYHSCGNENHLGIRGNLIINIIDKKHERFRRVGKDLFLVQREPISTLILGGEMFVKSLDKKFKIKIEPNSEGTEYILRGKGFMGGDLYVILEALIPKKSELEQSEIDMFHTDLFKKMFGKKPD